MSEDRYPYETWVNEALQGVLRRALRQLAAEGFTGDHHLFISFDTNHPDARVPGFLRAQYPDEITVVLQHQFEDLIVGEDSFQVSLSFNGHKQRLTVPFSAVRSFADPSVNFGLQINQGLGRPAAGTARPEADEARRSTGTEAATSTQSAQGTREENSDQGAEVITLDAFRKKS